MPDASVLPSPPSCPETAGALEPIRSPKPHQAASPCAWACRRLRARLPQAEINAAYLPPAHGADMRRYRAEGTGCRHCRPGICHFFVTAFAFSCPYERGILVVSITVVWEGTMNVLEMFLGTSGGLDAVINIAVYAVIVLLFIVRRHPLHRAHHAHARHHPPRHPLHQAGRDRQALLAGGQVPRQRLPLSPLERILKQPLLCRRRVSQRLQRRGLHQRGHRHLRPRPHFLCRGHPGADGLPRLPWHAHRPDHRPFRV